MASNKALIAPEITFDTSTGTGSPLAFSGPLTSNPSIIIFDNQSNVAVVISTDGTANGWTFQAEEAFVLDMRTNQMQGANDFTFVATQKFFATCAAGTGKFTIKWVYAS